MSCVHCKAIGITAKLAFSWNEYEWRRSLIGHNILDYIGKLHMHMSDHSHLCKAEARRLTKLYSGLIHTKALDLEAQK